MNKGSFECHEAAVLGEARLILPYQQVQAHIAPPSWISVQSAASINLSGMVKRLEKSWDATGQSASHPSLGR